MQRYKKAFIHFIFLLGCSSYLQADGGGNGNPCPDNPYPTCSGLGTESEVYCESCWYLSDPYSDPEYARQNGLCGIWLPEAPPLFRPFVADPRQVTYSVGWRFHDDVLTENVIPVSFGDIFPVYRWCDIGPWRGDLEFGVEGAVWAVFDPLHESSPLIDADYYVGFPITYAFGDWAFRLRGYHISTHIGDEFLLNHPHFDRRNPSIEAIDFYVSKYIKKVLRLYAGIGAVPFQDRSFKTGKWYVQAGAEYRALQWGALDCRNRLYRTPIIAMDFYYQSHFKNHFNSTFAIGYEWGKISGLRRRMRLLLQYHHGYSVDGQFSKKRTQYVSVVGTYGF